MMMIDAAWLAGLVEGEGCVDGPRGGVRLRIKMSDQDIVTRAAALMGSTVYEDNWNHIHNGHRPTWVAQITGARAVAVLREIAPMMGARRSAKIASVLSAYADRQRARILAQTPTPIPAPRSRREEIMTFLEAGA